MAHVLIYRREVTWEQRKVPDRGFDGVTKATDALQLDTMLEYISQYAPECLYRDITLQ